MPARARVATTAGAARSNERCSGSRATRAGRGASRKAVGAAAPRLKASELGIPPVARRPNERIGAERPEADILWGGESALFEKLADQKLLQKLEISREAWDSIPSSIGKPKPIPLKDPEGYWVGTALEPYGLVWHPRKLHRLGVPDLRDW